MRMCVHVDSGIHPDHFASFITVPSPALAQ
jgi:hypothetical protein